MFSYISIFYVIRIKDKMNIERMVKGHDIVIYSVQYIYLELIIRWLQLLHIAVRQEAERRRMRGICRVSRVARRTGSKPMEANLHQL